VFDSLISESATLPVNNRGPVINFFRSLRGGLISAGASLTPDPLNLLRSAAGTFQSVSNRAANVRNSCNSFDLDCVEAFVSFLGGSVLDILTGSFDFIVTALEEAVKAAVGPFVKAYLSAWVADIDDGLRHWNEAGLAFSKALFNPQARRDLQNERCSPVIGQANRDFCEEGVSTIDVLLEQENDFINNHLLSMLGLPDLVGELRGAFDEATDAIRGVVCGVPVLNIPCRVILTTESAIRSLAEEIVEETVKEVFGIDMEAIEKLESNMGAFMTLEQILPPELTVPLFGNITNTGIAFFNPGDHNRIDGYLHLPPNHHVPALEPIVGFPVPPVRLADNVEFVDASVAPISNTIMQSKLLLLDAGGLNQLLGDTLVDQGVIRAPNLVHTYTDATTPANIMVDALRAGDDPWLNLIDGDHAWRQDGLPRFCTPGATCPANPNGPVSTRRANESTGGTGQFPIWESCVLRPAFTVLYKDWENGTLAPFRELGDGVSPDPATDRDPPQMTFNVVGPSFQSGATLFVGRTSSFSLTAADATFTDSRVHTRFRAFLNGTTPPGFTTSATNGSTFTLPATTEGFWTIDFGAEDPCHTFAFEAGTGGADLLPPGTGQRVVDLDVTPPVITIQSPTATVFGSADAPLVSATAVDPGNGSGLATLTATLDGRTTLVIGNPLSLFQLAPGPHTIAFVATDRVGNSSQATRTFRILATSASILQNLDAARAQGLIPGTAAYNSFRAQLVEAIRRHNLGDFQGERGMLNGLIKAIIAARNQGTGQECPSGALPCRVIDPATANLLIAALAELIPNIGRTSLDSNGTTLGVLELLIQEFLNGNVASRASFDELRELVTHALDQHYQGLHSAEQDTLRSFLQDITTLLSRNQTVCSSRELPCFALDAAAATRLRTAANAVIAARG
jgi:hypothetical protein